MKSVSTPGAGRTRARAAAVAAVLLLGASVLPAGQATGVGPTTEVWLCPDHRSHPDDRPGACPVCGRALQKRRLATMWSCPMHPRATGSAGGACPQCGMSLAATTRELEWSCARHPQVVGHEPGACPEDGLALVERGAPMPHGDHNPRHGGVLFMAPDGFHHLEGTLTAEGTFRLYLYDDFTRPTDARAFRARVGDRPLAASPDGAWLELPAPAAAGREVEIVVHVRFPPGEREERFDFVLDRSPPGSAAAAAAATPNPPSPSRSADQPEALREALRDRTRRVDDLVRRGAWPDLFIPALEAKDLALALLEREGEVVARPVKTIVRAAWLLDYYGDLGRKAEVEAAHRLFAQGMADLEGTGGR